MRKALVKGSKEAKAFMAKIRAKKGTTKKVGGVLNTLKRKAVSAKKELAYSVIDKTLKNSPKKTTKDVLNRAKAIIKNTYLGSTLLIEKGENPRKKPTRVIQVDRTKKGLFKKFRSVSGIGAINGVNDVKKLKQLASSSKSPLFKKVASIIASKKTGGGYDTLESVFRDVSMGLQSGIISELIYYSDTTKWFKKYRKEIAKMLMDTMNEMGVDSPSDIFGKNWDTTDPFAEDTQNQNLLAWYSFEETARNISYSLGYEL